VNKTARSNIAAKFQYVFVISKWYHYGIKLSSKITKLFLW